MEVRHEKQSFTRDTVEINPCQPEPAPQLSLEHLNSNDLTPEQHKASASQQMHQVRVRKDDWLGGESRSHGGQVFQDQREAGLNQREKEQDDTIASRSEVELADGQGTPAPRAAAEDPRAAAPGPAADPAQAEIVKALPLPTKVPVQGQIMATTVLEEPWVEHEDNAWEDPGQDERRALHPLPKGLVELYGVLAVLLLLVPEWLADTVLERANISKGNVLTPFSAAWRRDPELLMGRMTLWQLRILAQQLGLRHYARNHREQLVNNLLSRMGEVDAQGLDALAQSLKQR